MIGLEKKYLEELRAIFSAYSEIEEVMLFGSRAVGTYKPNSDIDIAVKGQIDSTVIAKIIWDFDESDIPVNLDLVDYETISSAELIDHIKQCGELLYRKANQNVLLS